MKRKKINETKSCLFEERNKIDKLLPSKKEKPEKTQILISEMKEGQLDIKRLIK